MHESYEGDGWERSGKMGIFTTEDVNYFVQVHMQNKHIASRSGQKWNKIWDVGAKVWGDGLRQPEDHHSIPV